ncbi:MAG: hypothetical protein M3019_06870 [Candidatus Dormibacteraeota bacterium]|nr:hypothetical protein [Candidatus Dormibacteraeota bacterium]
MTVLGSLALTGDLFTGLSVGAVAGGVVGLLVLAAAAWWSWRFMKRRINRGQWRWERTVLRARALVMPTGPRREIVKMRLAVHDNVAQTQRVLRQPGAKGSVPASIRELLPPMERLAAGLDGQLRLWQTEPNIELVLEALPELRERGRTLIGQALGMRTSALQVIQDADRLARGPAEEFLQRRVEALNLEVPASSQLRRSGLRSQNPPLAIVEPAPRC